jgi:hypothetical protein
LVLINSYNFRNTLYVAFERVQGAGYPVKVSIIPECEICGEEADKFTKCKSCGAKFCEDCGSVIEKLCEFCAEEQKHGDDEDADEEDLDISGSEDVDDDK